MPETYVDESLATAQLIHMIVLFARGKSSIAPITRKARIQAKKLLGIKSLQTKDKQVYWLIPASLNLYLSRAGFDPNTALLTNPDAFARALLELDQEDAAKLHAKYAGQDVEARRQAIRNAMQAWRPTLPPKTAPPSQFIQSHLLNSKIIKHLQDD